MQKSLGLVGLNSTSMSVFLLQVSFLICRLLVASRLSNTSRKYKASIVHACEHSYEKGGAHGSLVPRLGKIHITKDGDRVPVVPIINTHQH